MRPAIVVILSLIMLTSCGSDKSPQEESASASVSDLSWLVGSWQDSLRPNQWEVWKANSKGMHGQGLNITADGDTTVFEDISLVQDGKQVFFIADVKGQDYPVKFTATRLEKGLAVFENPKHDFPKYISYQLLEEGKNNVMTSSVRAEDRRIDFVMVRR